jgi:hypothetical protein
LIDYLNINPKIWDALAQTINLFEELQVRHIFMQNTLIDDVHFPKFLKSQQKRPELEKLTFIKIVFGPNSIKNIFDLLDLNSEIQELRLVDCSFNNPNPLSQSIFGIDEFLDELCQDKI